MREKEFKQSIDGSDYMLELLHGKTEKAVSPPPSAIQMPMEIKSKRIHLLMRPSLSKRIKAYALAHGLSFNAVMEMAVTRFLSEEDPL